MARRLRRPEYAHPATLRQSSLLREWWYYSIELLPGVVTPGQYPADFPMLPRMMLRRADLRGMDCLDLGSVEGLMPVLMRRGGAGTILATDYSSWCAAKMKAVQHYYAAEFDFRSVGLMYNLHRQLSRRSFDFINCSGLLYHVFSPMSVLASVRPLLKRGGLMVVSTNVVLGGGTSMEFNDAGRMQSESNTFWYPTVPLLDYMLRYFRLTPVDMIHLPHASVVSNVTYVFDQPSAYMSVLCRATDAADDDEWMEHSAQESWEYRDASDWSLANRQPASSITFRDGVARGRLDLWDAAQARQPVAGSAGEQDSHTLRLSDEV